MNKKITIATRASKLASAQAEHVRDLIKSLYPEIVVDFLVIVTQGDKILDRSLAKVGGKGLFVKEIELALLNGDADMAVHSMKDVPADMTDSLDICSILKRHDSRDVFISNKYSSLDDLPFDAVVGTSSLRREAQLKSVYSISIKCLRGNVDSRLKKLDDGDYSGIVLAAAGLERINLGHRISSYIDPSISLPAAGQGAIGIQIREDRSDIRSLVSSLSCIDTTFCVKAERIVMKVLGGSCQVPLAANAYIKGGNIFLKAMVSSVDGKKVIRSQGSDNVDNWQILGECVANDLLDNGAYEILHSV
ncbi:hydroxymethylbilane synthase hemC [Candidatus Kinetoplastibacterium blastocrithidii TCC012E]|uniref:Porphobilinogen deaminase n=2 Tax=Candidatus Kinetoplastidibacterium blastocrithidiae TaxID=233181 RepID=M1M012_9PROT|nr:hydroxymethylbilane synthase [Candidatus Kinetoplastibacterium blastocrithidii]AEM25271.1 porphobilinogen deaminase [Candidatus Kinetoplastibacterium blastocrithidii]AFZ83527.1 porphobilinogen deaminase [Candidatus Kinetoplastibacterium blastocrithidii (ex Strigomonas culicis)]AGF49646.1 hydroxymethylbilane synthase hemC [Candidatus Kinetoplastibacterium blastocrithidii TCC012E]